MSFTTGDNAGNFWVILVKEGEAAEIRLYHAISTVIECLRNQIEISVTNDTELQAFVVEGNRWPTTGGKFSFLIDPHTLQSHPLFDTPTPGEPQHSGLLSTSAQHEQTEPPTIIHKAQPSPDDDPFEEADDEAIVN